MSRNFGFRNIDSRGRRFVSADKFSPYADYAEPDRRWPFYVIGAVTLMIVGIGVFIA